MKYESVKGDRRTPSKAHLADGAKRKPPVNGVGAQSSLDGRDDEKVNDGLQNGEQTTPRRQQAIIQKRQNSAKK